MIFHMKAAGKQLLCYMNTNSTCMGSFSFFILVVTVFPMLRVLSGTQKMLNTCELLGMDMKCYINDVIDSAGLHFSQ